MMTLALVAALTVTKFRVLHDPDSGAKVKVATVEDSGKQSDSEQALIMTVNSGSKIDGCAYLYTSEVQGVATAYVIKIGKDNRTRLRLEGSGWGDASMFTPEKPTVTLHMYLDKKETEKNEGKAVLAAYKKDEAACKKKLADAYM